MANSPRIVSSGAASAQTTALIQPCPSCNAGLDVTNNEPLSQSVCPSCGKELIIGEFIDHYQLLEVAGRGGMGVVYKALDSSLDRVVALKVLRKDRLGSEAIAQLENEASITASIHHPHVVKVFTTGSAHGRVYISMELVSCGTLEDLIRIQGRVAEAQALDIAIQIADGLRAAWQAGMIHRDVKPGNILFADAHTAKIVDFGLAMAEQAAAEAVGSEIWGTPYYIAPEKLDGQPEDFRSDIYSLGATLFHALAGRPPFEAENASLVALKHLKSQAVSLQAFAPWVLGSTAYVINRTLLKDPEQRYQSYDELIEHLEYAKNELLAEGTKPKEKKRLVLEDASQQKNSALITGGMLAFALIVAVVGFFALRKSDKPAVSGGDGGPASAMAASPEFKSAAALLSNADYPNAASAFHRFGEQSGASQPLLQWALLHEGLTLLLDRKEPESRAPFKLLASHALSAKDPDSERLAAFFTEVAAKAGDDRPIPAHGVHFDHDGYEALGLLIFGLKNWQLGYAEEALPLFREALQEKTPKNCPWIGDAATATSPLVDACTQFKIALDRFDSASSIGEKALAAKGLRGLDHAFVHQVGDRLKLLDTALAREEKGRDLTPGIYQIVNHKTHKALEVSNVDKDPDSHIRQAPSDAAKLNQKWAFYPLGGGTYRIMSLQNGKGFDLFGNSHDDGAQIGEYAWRGAENQRWKVEKRDDGTSCIVSFRNKACAIENDSMNDGAGLVQANRKEDAGQFWDLVHSELPADLPDGLYRFFNANSLQSLEVSQADMSDGAQVLQAAYGDGANQVWRIRHTNGWLEIVAEHSHRALDVYNFEDRDGAKIEQWAVNGCAAQLWQMQLDPGRGYKMTPKCSQRALTVVDQSKDAGALVTLRGFTAGLEQYWLPVPVK